MQSDVAALCDALVYTLSMHRVNYTLLHREARCAAGLSCCICFR